MATAKDLIPQKYEVLKTRTGTELVGMTRDIGDAIEITLPMICHLSLIPNSQKTQVVFYPYSPLSKTERIRMPKDHVVHRTPMNDQFIPHYDSASSTWMEMLEQIIRLRQASIDSDLAIKSFCAKFNTDAWSFSKRRSTKITCFINYKIMNYNVVCTGTCERKNIEGMNVFG